MRQHGTGSVLAPGEAARVAEDHRPGRARNPHDPGDETAIETLIGAVYSGAMVTDDSERAWTEAAARGLAAALHAHLPGLQLDIEQLKSLVNQPPKRLEAEIAAAADQIESGDVEDDCLGRLIDAAAGRTASTPEHLAGLVEAAVEEAASVAWRANNLPDGDAFYGDWPKSWNEVEQARSRATLVAAGIAASRTDQTAAALEQEAELARYRAEEPPRLRLVQLVSSGFASYTVTVADQYNGEYSFRLNQTAAGISVQPDPMDEGGLGPYLGSESEGTDAWQAAVAASARGFGERLIATGLFDVKP